MALQGPIPVEFGQVFPDGVYAAGGSRRRERRGRVVLAPHLSRRP